MSPAEAEFARSVPQRCAKRRRARSRPRAVLRRTASFGAGSIRTHAARQYSARALVRRAFVRRTYEFGERRELLAYRPAFVTLLRALRQRPRVVSARRSGPFSSRPSLDGDALRRRDAVTMPYGTAIRSSRNIRSTRSTSVWNAPPFPAVAAATRRQAIALGQIPRVWDVGNWDAGGIDLPLGESGEPGLPYYKDRVAAWLHHDLTPCRLAMPVAKRRATLTLAP